METAIIIRYCEIHLKGKNRGHFEKMLKENIKKSLKDIDFTFTTMHSRYLIENYDENDYDIIAEKLHKIAGVHTFSRAVVVDSTMDNILNAAKTLCEQKEGTFKVITNRADKTFTPGSMETSMFIGGKLLECYGGKLKVDVKNPSFALYIDIREDGKSFIYTDIEHGLSGMPVGSSGKGLLLISGGIDSPVAGYLTAKRGMKLDCLHFHSFPYTGEAAKEKVIELAKKVGEYNGGINLYVVSFTHIQEAIHKNCPEEFMITLMRRFMMRIAERLAIQQGDQAIITGESLGQVASQTIESITSSNSVVTLPVLRPLIAFDKLDIIEIARKIDTYETSILPYEDCCTVFLPKYPAIKPNLERVKRAESKLDVDALIDEAFLKVEKYVL
ncbi:MAG: tRNA 4-thiouridine(8) synthase ThiI [Clostridiales bacterium]|nr:tRNA 4-thiouridine(8) synthase ThiI [Clostridiales bacterium]